jgi:hypothetical protein
MDWTWKTPKHFLEIKLFANFDAKSKQFLNLIWIKFYPWLQLSGKYGKIKILNKSTTNI